MNRSVARGIDTGYGWKAQYRLVWRSRYDTVMKIGPDGKPKGPRYFETDLEAENAAWREKNDIEQPVMVRYGETLLKARTNAEAAFKPKAIYPGGGRTITIERKERVAAK